MFSKDFPPLKNDRIFRAIKGEKLDKLPVWIMRQAGRHLKEFRDFRTRYNFFEMCENPELACKVTLMPIERYELDAAIIFSDILVIPQALGLSVEMVPNTGPVILNPVTLENVGNLNKDGAVDRLKYVAEAVNLTRHKLEGRVPLFGFSGAPWTLMGYMIEGGGSKTYSNAKKWLYAVPEKSHILLSLLTDVIVDYLVSLVDAGAQVIQIFETNGEYLNIDLFRKYSSPYLKRIRAETQEKLLRAGLPNVPMILFVKGGYCSLEDQKSLGYDVIGVDWTVQPEQARSILGPDVVIQGNLDPCALYAPKDDIKELTNEMIKRFGTEKYIVNLGHGIYPDVAEENVEAFIKAVHDIKL